VDPATSVDGPTMFRDVAEIILDVPQVNDVEVEAHTCLRADRPFCGDANRVLSVANACRPPPPNEMPAQVEWCRHRPRSTGSEPGPPVNVADLLVDSFGRIHDTVERVLDGLTPEQLADCPTDSSNSIGWLVWHLTRVQDDHVAAAAGIEQVWTREGWCTRFDLPFDSEATGYGQTHDEVRSVRSDASQLLGYHQAVLQQTVRYISRLTGSDLERIVDNSWDPPVSLGVRLVSVLADDGQHAGQAAYVRGLITAHR
jgi:Protein of unknown function (DUF664)